MNTRKIIAPNPTNFIAGTNGYNDAVNREVRLMLDRFPLLNCHEAGFLINTLLSATEEVFINEKQSALKKLSGKLQNLVERGYDESESAKKIKEKIRIIESIKYSDYQY